jgi:hypothetical protein
VKKLEYRLRRRKLLDMGSLKGRILLLLGIQRAYALSPTSVDVHEEEGILMDTSPVYSDSHQIEIAFLRAERAKAMALMETKRQHMKTF